MYLFFSKIFYQNPCYSANSTFRIQIYNTPSYSTYKFSIFPKWKFITFTFIFHIKFSNCACTKTISQYICGWLGARDWYVLIHSHIISQMINVDMGKLNEWNLKNFVTIIILLRTHTSIQPKNRTDHLQRCHHSRVASY